MDDLIEIGVDIVNIHQPHLLNLKEFGKRFAGRICFDVAVDIRRSSPTFGKWVGAVLSAENKRQLWIPEGFAHGFMALSDTVQFVYKATNYYAPQSERSIIWNDPEIGIDWPALSDCALSLSEKDLQAHTLATAEVYK